MWTMLHQVMVHSQLKSALVNNVLEVNSVSVTSQNHRNFYHQLPFKSQEWYKCNFSSQYQRHYQAKRRRKSSTYKWYHFDVLSNFEKWYLKNCMAVSKKNDILDLGLKRLHKHCKSLTMLDNDIKIQFKKVLQ